MSPSRAPCVVLFDLGGVLLPFDRERRVAEIARRLICPPAAVRAIFDGDLPRRMDLGEAHVADFASTFAGLAGRAVGEDEACALILSVFEAPDVALWSLAGELAERVVVGGFSDNPPFVRQAFPPGARLEPMIFSAEIGAVKPTDQAFEAAEAIVGARGPQILFIDDAPANVEAARRRGWDAIRYASVAALRRDLKTRALL